MIEMNEEVRSMYNNLKAATQILEGADKKGTISYSELIIVRNYITLADCTSMSIQLIMDGHPMPVVSRK